MSPAARPPLPVVLTGWRWVDARFGDVALEAPDGAYRTKEYQQPARAIAAALRSLEQQPASAVRVHLAHARNWTGPGDPAFHLAEARAALAQLHGPDVVVLAAELDSAAAEIAATAAGEASLGTALIVAQPAIDGILLMDEAEARAATAAIVAAADTLRQRIDDFDQRRGWMALGYESFRAWALAEVPDTSIRYLYRLRDTNDVDRSLGVALGHTPERHARELKQVAVGERAAVLERADALAAEAGRPRQASDVQRARDAVTIGHTPPARPGFNHRVWQRRAAALGCNLKGYGLHWELVESDGTKTRYPNGCEDQLAAHILRLEGVDEPLPEPLPLPESDDDDEAPAVPADARPDYAAAELALAEELADASPRLRRLLCVVATYDGSAPVDENSLYDWLTDSLIPASSAALAWALAAPRFGASEAEIDALNDDALAGRAPRWLGGDDATQ